MSIINCQFAVLSTQNTIREVINMIDIKRLKENPEACKAGYRAKEVDCDATVP